MRWLNPFIGIIAGINRVARQQEIIMDEMDELDDLKTSMGHLSDAVDAGVAEITALVDKVLSLLSAPSGVDPVAVEAVAQQLQAVADKMSGSVADAKDKAGV